MVLHTRSIILAFLLTILTIVPIFSITFPNAHAASSTYSVTIVDYAFRPLHVNITTGTTVTWTYASNGSTIHTVTSDPGTNQTQGSTPLLDSGDLNPGQSYSYTFDLPGYYPYQCAVHPTIPAMNGWVMVTGNPVTPSNPSPNGSNFAWLPLAGIVIAAVGVAFGVWSVISRRRVKVNSQSEFGRSFPAGK